MQLQGYVEYRRSHMADMTGYLGSPVNAWYYDALNRRRIGPR